MANKQCPLPPQLVAAAKRNPRRAILAVAIISVLVSCYPVVFFGRRFVWANCVPMLPLFPMRS